jgi:hypothetical protein
MSAAASSTCTSRTDRQSREALERIGALLDIERSISSQSTERRRSARQAQGPAKLDELAAGLDGQLKLVPGMSDLAKAIRYARSRWDALTAYVDDGRLEISNNTAENAIRPVTLGRKKSLFTGSNAGGERAAIMSTLIRTALCRARHRAVYADCRTMPNMGSFSPESAVTGL